MLQGAKELCTLLLSSNCHHSVEFTKGMAVNYINELSWFHGLWDSGFRVFQDQDPVFYHYLELIIWDPPILLTLVVIIYHLFIFTISYSQEAIICHGH